MQTARVHKLGPQVRRCRSKKQCNRAACKQNWGRGIAWTTNMFGLLDILMATHMPWPVVRFQTVISWNWLSLETAASVLVPSTADAITASSVVGCLFVSKKNAMVLFSCASMLGYQGKRRPFWVQWSGQARTHPTPCAPSASLLSDQASTHPWLSPSFEWAHAPYFTVKWLLPVIQTEARQLLSRVHLRSTTANFYALK